MDWLVNTSAHLRQVRSRARRQLQGGHGEQRAKGFVQGRFGAPQRQRANWLSLLCSRFSAKRQARS
ncbi:hypothetical protein GGR61_001435 [Xanthomonas arboricola]|nr:hypothetical protein [Xanthomonas sp. 3058]